MKGAIRAQFNHTARDGDLGLLAVRPRGLPSALLRKPPAADRAVCDAASVWLLTARRGWPPRSEFDPVNPARWNGYPRPVDRHRVIVEIELMRVAVAAAQTFGQWVGV